MKFVLLFLLIPSFVFAGEVKINERVIENSKQYLFVREATNNNDHPMIDQWLKNCGLAKGNPYCQAFVVWNYQEAFNSINKTSPFPKYGRVAYFAEYCLKRPLTFKVISTKSMVWGVDSPQVGDVISWKHGSSVFNGFGYAGHAGLVVSSSDKLKSVISIEANTKSGYKGDQSGTIKGDMTYGNEGVYEKVRKTDRNTNFPIMYFIRLKTRTFEYE